MSCFGDSILNATVINFINKMTIELYKKNFRQFLLNSDQDYLLNFGFFMQNGLIGFKIFLTFQRFDVQMYLKSIFNDC